MSEECNDDENISYKYLYEKAIEGRKNHQDSYNTWMNMYSIFNGALFIGLYNSKDYDFLKFPILILGLVSGFFWYLSVCGFYRWIISWINVVTYYEQKVKLKNSEEKIFLYQMFVRVPNDDKDFLYSPISTQKLTKAFTLVVSVIWLFLAIREVVNSFSILRILGLMITLIFLAICTIKCCRENLKTSHRHFIRNNDGTFEEGI